MLQRILNKSTAILVAFFLLLTSLAQAQNAQPSSRKILGPNIQGYTLQLRYTQDKITGYWKDFMDDRAHAEADTKGYMTYKGNIWPELHGTESVILYSRISATQDSCKLWAGADPQGIGKEARDSIQDKTGELLKEFFWYVEKAEIQRLIRESEKATAYVSKQYDKLRKQERKLKEAKEDNSDKLSKYRDYVDNLVKDSATIYQDYDETKHKADSTYKVLENLRQIMEEHRKRVEELN